MSAERVDVRGPVDWWPFTRLLITASVLAVAAHFFFGWQVRPQDAVSLSGQMLGVLSLLAMISFALADLYLLFFLLLPLYVLGVLNDWAYAGSRWSCRAIFQIRSSRLLAFGGLCGEILLLGALACLIRRFL